MVTLKESQLDTMQNITELMAHKVNSTLDPWYPTVEEIRDHLEFDEEGDIGFLLWLTAPEQPLTDEQKLVKKEIHKMLYDPDVLCLIEEDLPDEDTERLAPGSKEETECQNP